MGLYIAYRIAKCHSESGSDDMTMKWVSKSTLFLDDTDPSASKHRYCQRILRPYSNERWGAVVWSIRELWYQAAQRTGSVETAARLLLEMMAPGKDLSRSSSRPGPHADIATRKGGAPVPEDITQYQDDLQALLTVSGLETVHNESNAA